MSISLLPNETTAMPVLARALQQFVERQTTVPIAKLAGGDLEAQPSPYGRFWYRAVAAMLLSGRVAAKLGGDPNMTDVNRLCKEANFNQYFVERIARFFVAAQVIDADWGGRYSEGPRFGAFWKHEAKQLRQITRHAVLELIDDRMGYVPQRATEVHDAHLFAFLALFFRCFEGRALPENHVGPAMHAFGRLPREELAKLARKAGVNQKEVQPAAWDFWLEEKGQGAILSALYTAEWAYANYDEKKQIVWFSASPIGLGMLGIGPVPAAPPLTREFKVASNLAVHAGAGLGFDKLVPLFRYCKVKRIAQVFEFQVDRRRLEETPSGESPGAELRQVLAELEPLPAGFDRVLETHSRLGGNLGIRGCSALVKPETPEVLTAIKDHPQLKGYLEPGAPPGYLLIKAQSRPDNFVRRCQELGFEVRRL